MTSQSSLLRNRSWTREGYLISTDHTLIPISSLNAMFASNDVYWANPLPDALMVETLQNSLCFGLFQTSTGASSSPPSPTTSTPSTTTTTTTTREFIGLARCITDFTTFLYLTDVHILPTHQGSGLGKWLIRCVDEVVGEMGWLRRAMLLTADWERSVPLYERELGMSLMGDGGQRREGVAVMGKKGPGVEGLSYGDVKKPAE